jgi:Ca2+-binding RTX toxin-like protein
MNGRAGNDLFVGGPLGDSFVGGSGNDRMYSRGGDDHLTGGGENLEALTGSDYIESGSGNDAVFLVDGTGDDLALLGGSPRDRCWVDRGGGDRVRSCENRERL